MLTIFKGDDTNGRFGRTLNITLDAAAGTDLTGCRAEFEFDGIVKVFPTVVSGTPLQLVFSHDETAAMETGVRYAALRVIDPDGKVRTFKNTIVIRVTSTVSEAYPGSDAATISISGAVAWTDISGKPAAYPPSAHTHTKANITDFPSTMPPSAHTHAQSDINGLADALGGKLDTTGGVLTGAITVQGDIESAVVSDGEFAIVDDDGDNVLKINGGGFIRNSSTEIWLPSVSGTLALTTDNAPGLTQSGVTALFANAVSSTASTTLKDRDCATVAFSSGMTLTFTASTGLRQFEILITDCTASGSINFPDVTYRGASDALTLEAGDNHLVFAEYAANCFFVTRSVANTITIS